ncbi:MAG: hypothetical protein A2X35_05790 [Elusimicrobia bacterium GWA2_61_42]|nr:MAG: hypothetical protein A2X35_05790 [Elusimicrobia bacterium GWA2_61_42]OGR74126.1 MAG: hypothetical protein A2X38_10880 [Elusimicrobia bacterium GWC2_61_25]
MSGCSHDPAAKAPPSRTVSARTEAPPCVPTKAILPGTDFLPRVTDEVRTAAIKDLLTKIAACRPLPYDHDGIVFGNREGLLEPRPRGYYREYTLPIPGRDIGDAPVPVNVGTQTFTTGDITSPRGPERLVIGGGERIFYTPDHYAHFVELRIVP